MALHLHVKNRRYKNVRAHTSRRGWGLNPGKGPPISHGLLHFSFSRETFWRFTKTHSSQHLLILSYGSLIVEFSLPVSITEVELHLDLYLVVNLIRAFDLPSKDGYIAAFRLRYLEHVSISNMFILPVQVQVWLYWIDQNQVKPGTIHSVRT